MANSSENRLSFGRVRDLYREFGPYLRPYRGRNVLAYVALVATTGMALLRPWPLKLVLDGVLLGKRSISETVPLLPASVDSWDKQALLTLLCASLVGIVLLESLFAYFAKVLFSVVGQSATTDILERVYTHLQTLPKVREDGTRTGDVIVRLTSDIKVLRDLLVNHVQKLAAYGLTFFSTLGAMALLDWRLSLLSLVVVPVIYTLSYRFSALIRDATRTKRKKEGAVASIVQETLASLKLVQAFAQEDAERRRFREEAQHSLGAGLESARLGGAFSRSIKVLNTVGTALVVWYGAQRVLGGTLTPGDLIVFAAYVNELYTPIHNLSELSVQFLEALISGERVLDLVQESPQVQDAPNARPAPRFQGHVRFEAVTFGYVPDRPVLRGISFEVTPGQTVALVGGSGSGKSTILNLLLRFHDPHQGRVLVDGEDVRGLQVRSVREQVGVVLQEPFLFRRTVAENIAYGVPSASRDRIVEAARCAQADLFIEALPDGYDTMLDEGGGNLSGGQRQRLALARAFLRDAPILVLDEPSTGLDPATEAQLNETLEELAKGRTTLLITHSLSLVEKADVVLVLDGGQIVQQGRHEELLAKGGLYRDLWESSGAAVEQEPAASLG